MTRVRGTTSPMGDKRLVHTARAQRHHVRIALTVESGNQAFSAETINTSHTGLALHLQAHAAVPKPGDLLVVRTTAAAAEPVRCRVVWVERHDHNSLGEEVVAVGACFMEPKRVAGFLAEADASRHALLLLASDDNWGDHIEQSLAPHCRVLRPRTNANAMSALITENISVLLCDDSMPHPGPVHFLTTVRSSFPRAPWVSIVAGRNPEARDLLLMFNTAQVFRYLEKPIEDLQLVSDVRSALRHFDDVRENETLRRELEHANEKLLRDIAALKKPS